MEDLTKYQEELDALLQFQLEAFMVFKKRTGAKGKIALGLSGAGSYVIKAQSKHTKYLDRHFMQPSQALTTYQEIEKQIFES